MTRPHVRSSAHARLRYRAQDLGREGRGGATARVPSRPRMTPEHARSKTPNRSAVYMSRELSTSFFFRSLDVSILCLCCVIDSGAELCCQRCCPNYAKKWRLTARRPGLDTCQADGDSEDGLRSVPGPPDVRCHDTRRQKC